MTTKHKPLPYPTAPVEPHGIAQLYQLKVRRISNNRVRPVCSIIRESSIEYTSTAERDTFTEAASEVALLHAMDCDC